MKAITKLIRYLTGRFDKTDEIFKALVGTEDGSPSLPPATSADYDEGAIANELAWLNGFVEQLIASINLNNVTTTELSMWETITGIRQVPFETLQGYVDKVLSLIAGEKHTTYGIIQSMLHYTDYVKVIGLHKNGAFANTCFANGFKYTNVKDPSITAAITSLNNIAGATLKIIVVLKLNDLLSSDAVRRVVVDVLRIVVAPGVDYVIWIIRE